MHQSQRAWVERSGAQEKEPEAGRAVMSHPCRRRSAGLLPRRVGWGEVPEPPVGASLFPPQLSQVPDHTRLLLPEHRLLFLLFPSPKPSPPPGHLTEPGRSFSKASSGLSRFPVPFRPAVSAPSGAWYPAWERWPSSNEPAFFTTTGFGVSPLL
ncbi:hypothetical protein VTN96DRAFT_3049 [Rasamsonia emersonii]